ncbi:MAG: hypothetical protein EA358_05180 [Flavobacteriales bacterium]|jgi:hypothetical protein|nr:MAG: hypothetical protein EA358_05180 [Flavobacteriales bacterium]
MHDPRTPDGRPIWYSAPFVFTFIIAMILPVITLYIFSKTHGYNIQQEGAIKELVKVLNVRLLSASVILNAGLFFLALKFDKELIARGILYGTVVVFALIFIYKYLF